MAEQEANLDEAIRDFNDITDNVFTICEILESQQSFFFVVVNRNLFPPSVYDTEIWQMDKDCPFPYPYSNAQDMEELPDDFWTANKVWDAKIDLLD